MFACLRNVFGIGVVFNLKMEWTPKRRFYFKKIKIESLSLVFDNNNKRARELVIPEVLLQLLVGTKSDIK